MTSNKPLSRWPTRSTSSKHFLSVRHVHIYNHDDPVSGARACNFAKGAVVNKSVPARGRPLANSKEKDIQKSITSKEKAFEQILLAASCGNLRQGVSTLWISNMAD